MQYLKSGFFLLLINAGVVTLSHAQPMPLPNNPAQEILLQQQRERELREQMDSTANVRAPEPQALTGEAGPFMQGSDLARNRLVVCKRGVLFSGTATLAGTDDDKGMVAH